MTVAIETSDTLPVFKHSCNLHFSLKAFIIFSLFLVTFHHDMPYIFIFARHWESPLNEETSIF